MLKIFVGVIGIIFFIYGIILFINLTRDEKMAFSLDAKKTAFAEIGDNAPPPCKWDVKFPQRVIAENKSQALVVQTKNAAAKECNTVLSLRAPGFDMSPAKEEQNIILRANSKGSLSWIITPRTTGVYQIAVSDITDTRIFGITVTNVFGLNGLESKFLSILSSLFGPMLTIPWWWDKWRQKK